LRKTEFDSKMDDAAADSTNVATGDIPPPTVSNVTFSRIKFAESVSRIIWPLRPVIRTNVVSRILTR
jgi:hypothetical protein